MVWFFNPPIHTLLKLIGGGLASIGALRTEDERHHHELNKTPNILNITRLLGCSAERRSESRFTPSVEYEMHEGLDKCLNVSV